MSMIPAAAYGAVRYGPAAIGAITRIQRWRRNLVQGRRLLGYARGLRRMYDRYGARAVQKMIKAPKRGAGLPNQNTNSYRLTRMSGTYGGKFKKPKKLSKKANPYQTKGFENTIEVTGTITDPDCVYLAASSISTTHSVECVARGLLRALLEKCIGTPITNVKSRLQGYFTNVAPPYQNGDGYLLQLTWYQVNVTTGELQDTHITTEFDSIYSLTGDFANGVVPGWPGLMNKLRQWAGKTSTPGNANTEVPLRLNVYRRDGNGTLFYFGSGGIDLRNTYVNYEATSSVKIQNRSVSATGSSSTDVVDANPLQGYMYEFKGGVPMFKNLDQQSGTLRLNRIFDIDAVATVRSAEFGNAVDSRIVDLGFVNREPPKPRFFSNCVKSSKIMLKPGDVKTYFFKWSTKMKLLDFLMKTAGITDASVVRQTVNLPGKCVMFALEDMLNVNAANLIAISYEVNRVDKCYIHETKYKVAQGTFTQRVQNNLTP